MSGRFYVIKSLQVKSGFLLSELRYYVTLHGIFLPQNLGLHLISQKNIENCKSYEEKCQPFGFFWTPFKIMAIQLNEK